VTQRIALVTGASRGLGAAIAEELAARGWHVVAVARTVGGLEDLDDRIKARGQPGGGEATLAPMDVTNDDAMRHLCLSIHERWGQADLWVHAAIHTAPLSPAGHIDVKDWEKSIATNVRATGLLIPMVDSAEQAEGVVRAIRYPDGTLKNLTAAAGFGATGFQGGAAIAVREPSVHWSGTRAIFSMVVGGTDRRYVHGDWRWQLYEITGLAAGDTPVITRVPNQPSAYNNVSPIYGTDDRILFTSDRPRGGEAHLYPQLDEYEEAPVVTGIWSLDPASGDLFLVQHSPSGSFSPQVESEPEIGSKTARVSLVL